MKQREATSPHIWGTGTRKCLVFGDILIQFAHHFDPDYNISTTIGRIVMKCDAQKKNLICLGALVNDHIHTLK